MVAHLSVTVCSERQETRVHGYLREEWSSWKWTTSKQPTPKFSPRATDQSRNWDGDDTDVLFVVGTHGSQRWLNAPFDTGIMQTEKRPGLHVAIHYSEETAAVEKSRNDVETVTWKPHSQVNVTRTAETTWIRSDALSLFLLVGLSLRLTYFLVPRRSLFHSFSLLADLSQLTEGNDNQPESFFLPL